MRKGKTKSGFEFEIDETTLDDMIFMEQLAASRNDALAFPAVLTMMFGEEQKKRLYEHLKDEHGRVPIAVTDEEISEIMQIAAGETAKNSEPSPT